MAMHKIESILPQSFMNNYMRLKSFYSRWKWRYIDNLIPLVDFCMHQPNLTGEAERVLADLNRNGVAITSAVDLFGTNSAYSDLKAATARLEDELANEIQSARARANDANDWKSYVYWLLGERPCLDPNDIFVRFTLQKPILQVVNAYFKMCTQLRFYNVWHTLASQVPARDSQLWHRDPEDYCILKVFVYLTDVDDDAGPFTYATGSHSKGHFRRRSAATFLNNGVQRSSDEQMQAAIPSEHWIKATGSEGTIIFADTRGYHKGGLTRGRDRIMYNSMFTSKSAKSEWFERVGALVAPTDLDREQAFALNV